MLLPYYGSIVRNQIFMALLCSLCRNTWDWTMLTNEDIDPSPKIRQGQELPGIVVVEIRLQGTISFK